MAKRYRRNPTAAEMANEIAKGGWFIPDFLKLLADKLEDGAERESDDGVSEAMIQDASLLRKIVREYGRDFSE